jgi:hypothetical protein
MRDREQAHDACHHQRTDGKAQKDETGGQKFDHAQGQRDADPDPPECQIICHYPRPFNSLKASPKAAKASAGTITV